MKYIFRVSTVFCVLVCLQAWVGNPEDSQAIRPTVKVNICFLIFRVSVLFKLSIHHYYVLSCFYVAFHTLFLLTIPLPSSSWLTFFSLNLLSKISVPFNFSTSITIMFCLCFMLHFTHPSNHYLLPLYQVHHG